MKMKYIDSVTPLSEPDGTVLQSCCGELLHPLDMDILTPQQEKILKQFTERVSPLCKTEEDKDPHFLSKWLIARDFNIEKAEKMFRKAQDWREEINIAGLLAWNPPEVLIKYGALGFPGFDKHGGAVVIIPHGRVDIRGLFHSTKKGEYVKYTLRALETSKAMMAEESKKRNVNYCRVTCIFDMEGFSIKEFTWKPAMEAVVELLKLYEANYPEYLNCAYVINAPKVFSIAWALVKPFLNQNTINKVQIFGKSGWKEEILKDISADVLPIHWGGTRMEPDEMCTSFMCMGGKVPTSYYLKNRPTNHLTTVSVGKGASVPIDVEVKIPGSTIRWEFETEDYDISFVLDKKGGSDKPLVPSSRVESHIYRQEGEVNCPEAGIYVAVFDNSYSYVRSKTVKYSFDVIPPVTAE